MIRTVLSLALVGMLTGSPAAAAPSKKRQARKLYKQGKHHFKKKAYAAAVSAFKRSYALFPHRNTVYNIALSLAHQGERVAAFRSLRNYLEKATPRDPPLDDILRRVREGYGVLKVVVLDPQAGIFVDGRRLGKGTLQRVLPSGTRALEIRQGDKAVVRKEINLPGGQVVRLELGMVKVTARQPVDDIYLDGRLVGRGRLSRITTVGDHVVELRRATQVIQRKELNVVPGKITEWKVEQATTGGGKVGGRGTGHAKATDPATDKGRGKRLHWVWFTTLAAVTVATAVGATVTSVQTSKIWQEFKDDRNNRSLADRGDRMQAVTNTLWGVSAALAAGTILVAIFTRWRSSTEQAKVTLTPLLGPAGAGATLTWRH